MEVSLKKIIATLIILLGFTLGCSGVYPITISSNGTPVASGSISWDITSAIAPAQSPQTFTTLTLGTNIKVAHPDRQIITAIDTMPNGNQLAILNGYEAASPYTTWDLWQTISSNGGLTWGTDSLIVPIGTNYCSLQGGLLVSTDRVFLFHTRYIGDSPAGEHNSHLYVRVTTDNALTWSADTLIDTTWDNTYTLGTGIRKRNGTLIMPIMHLETDNPPHFWASCLISTNNGNTWTVGGLITLAGSYGILEPSFIERLDGSLYALLRTSLGRLYYSTSANDGLSWTAPLPTTLVSANNPGALKRLSFIPNIVLVTWDNHAINRLPLVIAKSTDDCATFSTPIIVDDTAGTYRCYPGIGFNNEGKGIIWWWGQEGYPPGTPGRMFASYFNPANLW